MWAGLSSSQVVLGAIRIQVGAEGDLSKDSSAHSHSSAELCPCCWDGLVFWTWSCRKNPVHL